MIVYAWCVWLYRLFLFIGIALLVYFLFFKPIGIALFIIEIVWFIALPILRECQVWWKMRRQIMATRRTFVTVCVVLSFIAITFVPMRWVIRLPAVIEAGSEIALHVPHEARIQTWNIAEGQRVSRGDILATLEDPRLEHKLLKVNHQLDLLRARLARMAGDATDLAMRTTIEQEQRARREERAGYLRQKRELTLRAVTDGILRDVDKQLHVGAWASPRDRLGRVVVNSVITGRAYANEDVLKRLRVGSVGSFMPDDPLERKRQVILSEIASVGTDDLTILQLSSVFGGAVASERDVDNRVRPVRSQYVIRMKLDEQSAPIDWVMRGVVRFPGKPESLADAMKRQIMRVLVREAGL